MEPDQPDHIISIRRGLRWVIAVSLVAVVALLIAAVAMKPSDAMRTNTLLTFVGLAVAALLADIHVGAVRRSPRWVMAGVTAIVASQLCYFLWVWTGLATESLLYRLWWLLMVPAVSSAHLLALRAVPACVGMGQRDLIERGTPKCVMALGLTLMGFALYRDVPPQLGRVHLWLTGLLSVAVLVGSFVTWRRWARSKAQPAALSRGARIAWRTDCLAAQVDESWGTTRSGEVVRVVVNTNGFSAQYSFPLFINKRTRTHQRTCTNSP